MRVKDIFLAVLSGILLVLSFPNFNLSFLAWIALVPLLLATQKQSLKNTFLLGFISGLVSWVGILYWIVPTVAISGNSPWILGIVSLLLLAAYLSLYLALFWLVWKFFTDYRLPITGYLLLAPSLWVVLEFLRGRFTFGFPWALLGYSQWKFLPLIQISEYTGAYGVSFLIVLVNVAITTVIGHPPVGEAGRLSVIREKIKVLSIPALTLLVCLGYGFFVIHSPLTTHHWPLAISVLQGNIPQSIKWDEDHTQEIISVYTKLVRKVTVQQPDLIIWPETALPGSLKKEPWLKYWVSQLAKTSKTFHLIGGFDIRDNCYYNSAFLISSEGKVIASYAKIHLVPFGEYVPFKFLRRWIRVLNEIGDITPGKEYKIFYTPKGKFCVGICYETIFPELIRKFVQRGSDLIVNITNDAWFGKTSAPQQHFIANIFRAVENRRWVVRAANTGISGFIDPYGKIVNSTEIFETDFLISEVSALKKKTFYTSYGNVFVYICGLIVLIKILTKILKSI